MTKMVMTNSVICPAPILVIETDLVSEDRDRMKTQPKTPLPRELAEAMRPESIGHRLRLLRESQELSPAEMADLLGIERTYWSRFENGRRAINETTAALLVAQFGVTLDFLILGRWDKLPLDLATKMRDLGEK
ncbi:MULTISPECIES: helix-turn-helix domain-containing protein [unclassified Salipiger]|uniref:helix-turn-helix domain-containing protein n=1 Tax=unclassified Salipiger TaxID=2640570 RepID=UPI0013BA70A0|nr:MULTISPECIES: helix-turn-helix transcriptional regulator [unclassified Salipiger]NDV51574.1 helix-turn-helix transcriptional regulator [Salipiger sp. PrR003]NDW31534.1 helix-turn-helix transcriptional regulator [Salipiger sp. PrR007]